MTNEILSLVISVGSLLGVVLTSVTLFSIVTKRAKEDGVKEQQFSQMQKDIAGIGKKARLVENETNKLIVQNVKMEQQHVNLEQVILSKMEGIETMLKEHMRRDHREDK